MNTTYCVKSLCEYIDNPPKKCEFGCEFLVINKWSDDMKRSDATCGATDNSAFVNANCRLNKRNFYEKLDKILFSKRLLEII